jgi:hypothetical protein
MDEVIINLTSADDEQLNDTVQNTQRSIDRMREGEKS